MSDVDSIALPKRLRPVRETPIVASARAAINRLSGVRCTRNNTGKSPKPCATCFPRLCPHCTIRLRAVIPFGLGSGGPDIVGFFYDLPLPAWFGVEIKRPREHGGGTLSKDQRLYHAEAKRFGVEIVTARSAIEAVDGVRAIRALYEERIRAHVAKA